MFDAMLAPTLPGRQQNVAVGHGHRGLGSKAQLTCEFFAVVEPQGPRPRAVTAPAEERGW